MIGRDLRLYDCIKERDCLRARVAEMEAETVRLMIERDIYRTLALRHEARIAELEGTAREVVRDYPIAAGTIRFGNEPGDLGYGSIKTLCAVLNAPANATESEVMPNSVAAESAVHSCDNAAPRPAQSPAGAKITEQDRAYADDLVSDFMETEGDQIHEVVAQWVRKIRHEAELRSGAPR